MKINRRGITEILRRGWLFSANKIKSSESFSRQPTQIIDELFIAVHNCDKYIIFHTSMEVCTCIVTFICPSAELTSVSTQG